MDPTAAAILTGLCVGTFGALLPGPLSRALIARAEAEGVRGVLRGSGASAAQLMASIAVGLGAGPLVRGVAATCAARLVVAFVYVAFGAGIAVGPLRGGAPSAGFPTMAAKWVLVVAFATLSGLAPTTTAGAVAFAVSVWAGAFAWLALLAVGVALVRPRDPEGALRGLTLLTATGLVAIGVWTAHAAMASAAS